MLVQFVAFAAQLTCSTVSQDCPKGQMCVAEWNKHKKVCPQRGQCEPRPSAAEIELWLPIPDGDRIVCGKGMLRPDTSHNPCVASTRFSFDLISSSFDPPHIVVASADGVAYARGGCPTTDLNYQNAGDDCNDGWGNYVRVQHDPSLYTQYAHLSAILVHDGQRIVRGQPIGIEGNTGQAGSKHIHWSAHRGDARRGGPSIPMAQIRLKTGIVSADDLVCGDWSHGAPITDSMRLVSGTPLVHEQEQFGFDAKVPTSMTQAKAEKKSGCSIDPGERPTAPVLLFVFAALAFARIRGH
ncbi:MAG TPA: M23 family metallopeptidase [Casimicrobiaceae bacterium]|nr:M23 family metallopeptidase [Casimicrobiaceae bacterium]